MRYEIHIKGTGAIIMHNGAAGLDTRSPAKLEIAEINRKKGSNRTEVEIARLYELECQTSLWLDADGTPTIPEAALRRMIETAARKLKQGGQVREGLIVERILSFDYDREKYGTDVATLGKTAQFTVAVVVGQSRVLRTRAKFDDWACRFVIEVDDELCDLEQLQTWLDIGGRRIGLGDWRPEKSGSYGRFEQVEVKPLPEDE